MKFFRIIITFIILLSVFESVLIKRKAKKEKSTIKNTNILTRRENKKKRMISNSDSDENINYFDKRINIKQEEEPTIINFAQVKFLPKLNDIELRKYLKNILIGFRDTDIQLNDLINLLERCTDTLKKEKFLNHITLEEGKYIIVGNIHGSYKSLFKIINDNGLPDSNHIYIFNGDYTDGGKKGANCLAALLTLKIFFSDYIFLNRGDHESLYSNENYGFMKELKIKYGVAKDSEIYKALDNFYAELPFAQVLNKKIFVVHAGIPRYYETLSLTELERMNKNPTDGVINRKAAVMNDLISSGPIDWVPIPLNELYEIKPNIYKKKYKVEPDIYFNEKAINTFLKKNQLSYIIRSHSPINNGYSEIYEGKLKTIFSASCYDNTNYNGAYAIIKVKVINDYETKFSKIKYIQNEISKYCPDIKEYYS